MAVEKHRKTRKIVYFKIWSTNTMSAKARCYKIYNKVWYLDLHIIIAIKIFHLAI